MADNHTAERDRSSDRQGWLFRPDELHVASFAEIRPRFSRSRDPTYVTPDRGTNLRHVSRDIWRNTSYISRQPDRFDEVRAAKMREISPTEAVRDRRNGFSSLERTQRRRPEPRALIKQKEKPVPPRWSRCAAPRGLPSPDKSLSSPAGFYLRPVKIANEHETTKSSVTVARERISVESIVFEGCDEVGGAPRCIFGRGLWGPAICSARATKAVPLEQISGRYAGISIDRRK